jgi:hypothetical protein
MDGCVGHGKPASKRRNAAGSIEDGALGVDVKVDERRFGHGKPILPAGIARTDLW